MKKLILLATTLSFLLTAFAVAKDKKTVIKSVEITATSLRARTGPDVKYWPLGEYARGTVLPVYEEKDGWYKTDCPRDAKLFIFSKFIKVKGADGVIQGNNVNARSRADTKAVVCMKFNHKTKVTVKGQVNDWIQIAPPSDAYAWISAKSNFVKTVIGNNKNINIVRDDKPLKQPVENNTEKPIKHDDTTHGITKNESNTSEADDIITKSKEKKEALKKAADDAIKDLLDNKEKNLKKGWVRRLGRVIGRKATHAIYITKGNDLFHLISTNNKIKLEDYANMYVGVLGEDRGKEKRSKVNLIAVSEIKVYKSKSPQIKLKSSKNKK